MAKSEVAVTQESTQLSTELMDEIAGEQGMGYSERSEDSMVPILGILQDNSAEVKTRHSKHIEGARPGDLIIRSIGRVIPMGDTDPPISVQPCGFDHQWVEWAGEPGEGAPVANYPFDDRPADAVEKPKTDGEGMEWRMPNGNRLVDTRYHYVNLIDDDGSSMPLVIPMSGSNHTPSRQWTAQMKQFTVPGRPGVKAKSFMRAYGLRTAFNQRGSQSWYKYSITDFGWIQDEAQLYEGLSLFRAVRDQEVSAEVAEAPEQSDDIPV